jgi:hypothetical protein
VTRGSKSVFIFPPTSKACFAEKGREELWSDLRIEKILDIFRTHSQNILRLLPPPENV